MSAARASCAHTSLGELRSREIERAITCEESRPQGGQLLIKPVAVDQAGADASGRTNRGKDTQRRSTDMRVTPESTLPSLIARQDGTAGLSQADMCGRGSKACAEQAETDASRRRPRAARAGVASVILATWPNPPPARSRCCSVTSRGRLGCCSARAVTRTPTCWRSTGACSARPSTATAASTSAARATRSSSCSLPQTMLLPRLARPSTRSPSIGGRRTPRSGCGSGCTRVSRAWSSAPTSGSTSTRPPG